MTNVDKALLLLAEWFAVEEYSPLCPCCSEGDIANARDDGHRPGCVMDLALAERGFATQEDRDRVRAAIGALSGTVVSASASRLPRGVPVYFVRIPCETKIADGQPEDATPRDYRPDAIVLRIPAANESDAVTRVARKIEGLVSPSRSE